MKKYILGIMPLLFIFIAIISYKNIYNIDYDSLYNTNNLKSMLQCLDNVQQNSDYTLGDYVDYNNYRYTLFLNHNKAFGIIKFKKGLNGRYMMDDVTTNYGSVNKDNAVITPINFQDNYAHFLIYADNINNLIDKTSVTINENTVIENKVPLGNHFIELINFHSSSDMSEKSSLLTDFKLLDKNHKDISQNYSGSSGGISIGSMEYIMILSTFVKLNIILAIISMITNTVLLVKKKANLSFKIS
ncbi:hypothetical protein [Inconstantimicrobium mannanitabidum]|uniref:Uncharacterized protein n=1 Tax=Inconstantimicrobium mannanitabidum TaxID=1604901 RepID=A0ACB5RHL8_9CLOT|nr:hypothetical protein [Clostridium sp. TW13]GKX68606.1 hypothetical protein rsdtw13_38640 [Clostridium sp. TW13]